ncbi:MAG: AMP-binding protein [Armatimonadota bacterium]|nr:AMP-binding protein [Armatimonadota bacterium]MDR7450453.1 AMP-binding protein [Armatimonadota bacterium]MDR7466964.1 AMP-binding protein [Armatimonadota bacterium]MDR7493494.1 AMP-binding protein [Armatimonadota bacterium]MDR7498759.1 AMP-binding protein [Armatimonadota bacterium]
MARALLEHPRSVPSPSGLPRALDTLPKLLRHNAERFGDRTAFREKDLGIWQPISWRRYFHAARDFGLGLQALGFRRGEVLAIVGDNRPELYYAALGAQSVGGISYGLYQDSLSEQLAQLIDFSEARFVFCEDQEQTDKVLDALGRLRRVEFIIVDDWRGMWRYRHPMLLRFEEVLRRGRERHQADPRRFDEEIDQGRATDVAIFCQTSGTTALPKLAMLSHANLISQGLNFHAVESHIGVDDEFVSYLPFAWIGEQMLSVSLHQLVGFTVNFPEEPETAQRDFREIAPRFTFAPARIYEGLHTAVTVRILDAGWLRRKVYDWGLGVGGRIVERRADGQPVSWWLRVQRSLARWLVYRPLLDKIGFARLRVAWNGGSPLGPDYFKFFHALGVNLKQIYGQTEMAGISCVHRDGAVRFWTMGSPIANTEVRVTEEGEIVSRSPALFQGYFRNPEATARALRDGWLYSGDYGTLDPSGDVIMFDRMSDVLVLADGTRISPWVVEAMLKFTPYIQEAMVVLGPDRRTLAAILNIEMRSVGKWAEDRGIAYTSYADLSQKPQVLDLLQGLVAEVNSRLRPEWRLRRFLSLYKEFHPDDDELTRTRKLRRSFIQDRYRDLVAALCSDAPHYDAVFTIRYEDGRTGEVRTRLAIRDLP